MAEDSLRLDSMAGGGRFILGSVMEGAPVKLDGRLIGRVHEGAVVVTDEYALRMLRAGSTVDLSIGPLEDRGNLVYGIPS